MDFGGVQRKSRWGRLREGFGFWCNRVGYWLLGYREDEYDRKIGFWFRVKLIWWDWREYRDVKSAELQAYELDLTKETRPLYKLVETVDMTPPHFYNFYNEERVRLFAGAKIELHNRTKIQRPLIDVEDLERERRFFEALENGEAAD